MAVKLPMPSRARSSGTPEKEIIRAAQAGDINAYETLVRTYQTRVQAVARRIVGSPEDARDVAQEVFVKLYRFLPKFRREKTFFTWLYKLTVNAAYDFLRKESRHQSVPIEDFLPQIAAPVRSGPSSGNDLHESILALIQRLTFLQRSVLILRDVEELSVKEISDIVGCRPATVRSHLRNARIRLKSLIIELYPEYLKEAGA